MSSALVWNLIKNNNCFKVSQGKTTFSRDPYSPTGLQNATDSGLSHNRSLSIKSQQKDKKKAQEFVLSFNKRQRFVQKSQKPHKDGSKTNFKSETLKVKRGVHAVGKIIKKRYTNKKVAQKYLKKLVNLHRASLN